MAKGLSVAQLADILSWTPEVDGRKVVDQTGIEGTFDFSLRWAFERAPSANSADLGAEGAPPNTAAPPDTSGPSIFTALQKQLGLKLEATKGPVDYLVIDYIEKPSEN
jgi:bla regulator protein blaR1